MPDRGAAVLQPPVQLAELGGDTGDEGAVVGVGVELLADVLEEVGPDGLWIGGQEDWCVEGGLEVEG